MRDYRRSKQTANNEERGYAAPLFMHLKKQK
nr:MAG TPA: hypothetical protein [Caudoviricetes sp.]